MIQLPLDFQTSTLFSEFFHLAAPFAGIAMLIACGFLINRMLKNVP